MATRTFWMEPAGVDRLALRRYETSRRQPIDADMTCEKGFHQAVAWPGDEVPTERDDDGMQRQRPTIPADDPRWPAACDGCGRPFGEHAERQVWLEQVFRRTDTGELRVLHRRMHPPDIEPAEAGATWDAVWMPAQWRGPDGVSLMVRCPRNDGAGAGSDWAVDMPSTNSGGRWERDGDPRRARVTASPSIAIGQQGAPAAYHGWLQNGELSNPI